MCLTLNLRSLSVLFLYLVYKFNPLNEGIELSGEREEFPYYNQPNLNLKSVVRATTTMECSDQWNKVTYSLLSLSYMKTVCLSLRTSSTCE